MDRSRLGRGLAILAIASLAVAVVSPAFSAATLTKAKVKKIAKKQINKLVPGMIDDATIDQGTIPQVTASVTDPDKTVTTFGPFTITLNCYDSGGSVGLELTVKTSEQDSHVADNWNGGYELDPADGEVHFQDLTGNPPGGESKSSYNPYYGALFLRSPSGTNMYAVFDTITSLGGTHCTVDGWFLNLAA
jgi:hypothetical protein